jgi:hypothetical protein
MVFDRFTVLHFQEIKFGLISKTPSEEAEHGLNV